MMTTTRPPAALRSRRFGRGRAYVLAVPESQRSALLDDMRLFATTFVGGLLFMTIYLS